MKHILEKTKKLFTISKRLLIIIVLVNIVFLCYHIWWIGMDFIMASTLQLAAFLTELLVSGFYEKLLQKSNRIVNKHTRKTKKQKNLAKFFGKTSLFILCFLLVYISTYCGRLLFFYYILHWGITPEKLENGIRNAILFAPIFGMALGFITIAKFKKKKNSPTK